MLARSGDTWPPPKGDAIPLRMWTYRTLNGSFANIERVSLCPRYRMQAISTSMNR